MIVTHIFKQTNHLYTRRKYRPLVVVIGGAVCSGLLVDLRRLWLELWLTVLLWWRWWWRRRRRRLVLIVRLTAASAASGTDDADAWRLLWLLWLLLLLNGDVLLTWWIRNHCNHIEWWRVADVMNQKPLQSHRILTRCMYTNITLGRRQYLRVHEWNKRQTNNLTEHSHGNLIVIHSRKSRVHASE